MSDEYEVKRFGDLEEGDILVGADGQPVPVLKAYEHHTPERMYEIEVEGRDEPIRASGNHLWYIESAVDLATHKARLREAKKLLKNASPKLLDGLHDIAMLDEVYEITLMELVEVLDFIEPYEARYNFARRVVSSIGHIAEETKTYQDLSTGEEVTAPMDKIYDGTLAARQILGLTGLRKYKKYKVIPGRVVTTDELALFYDTADLPTVQLK